MKQFNKTVLAVALLAAAGSASAFTSGSTSGANEAYLVAFDANYVNTDASLGRTYNLDLGVTFNGLKTAVTNGTLGSVLNKDLTTDANYTSFLTLGAGETTQAITWGVYAAGDTFATLGANNGVFETGSSLTSPAPQARTSPAGSVAVTWGSAITAINQHGAEITTGLATGTSSLIQSTDVSSSGQADSVPSFSNLWGQAFTGDIPTIAFNTNGNFYYGGTHLGDYQLRPNGTTAHNTVMLAQSDIQQLGQLKLSPAGLTAVPLPAAVWLFGAGLMGMLRLNRRKAA